MKKTTKNFKNLLFLLKPFWNYGKLYVLLALILPVVCNIVSIIVSTFMNGKIVDAIVDNFDFWSVFKIALFYTALLLITLIIDSFTTMMIQNKYYHKISSKIKFDIYNKAIRTDVKNTDSPSFYDAYSWTINEYVKQSDSAVMLLSKILVSITSIITAVSVISNVGWLVLIISLLYTLSMLPINKKLSKYTTQKKEALNTNHRRLGYIQRLVYQKDFLFSLRITNFKRFIFGDLEKTYENVIDTQNKYNSKIFAMTALQNILSQATSLLIIFVYVWLICEGKMSVGSFVVVMSAVTILRRALNSFSGYYKNICEMSLSTKKIHDFFDTPSAIEESVGTVLLDDDSKFSLEFQNVSFKYPNSEMGVYDINFKINSGMKVAIVGCNGSGKSTLVKLALRLYDTDNGAIYVNGNDIKSIQVENFRENIGVALQESQVFAYSIKENLSRYFDTDDTSIENVLNKLNMQNVIKMSKHNFNHSLLREFDPDGIELSGGEKQKIAIASIMDKKFGLLIFDEPTSALDPFSEFELNELILGESNKTTTIIISHRLTTVKKADLIIVMDNGRIVEQGTHDDLIEKKGLYYEMYDKQSREYIE